MNTKKTFKTRVINLCRQLILKANYVLNNYGDVIWLLGDGRSGTTWVSDLINHDRKYREMFEPFHPEIVRNAKSIVPHQYIRRNDLDEELMNFASDIFSGKFTNARVDSGNRSLLYNGILIKDIFANLLCYPVSIQFPKVKPVMLIRNPFSVAISKYKKKHWFWVTEPLALLDQTSLYEDYLYLFEDIIRTTSAKKNFILNQVLIWSIIHYVPLRQFKPGNIYICFYERIYTNPNQEISNILRYVKGESDNYQIKIKEEILSKPSRVAGSESNLLAGVSPILSWKNELSPREINDGLKLLQHFKLDDLYDDKSMPNIDVHDKIYRSA
jgi:hypothetical protein